MGHLMSTVNPQVVEELQSAGVWAPAGPALVEDGVAAAIGETITNMEPVRVQIHDEAPHHHVPGVGNMVVYHLRAGDSRNRRTKFPAIVMDGDAETGLLKLWVIVDDGDTWMQDNVPARAGSEPGWVLVDQPVAAPAPAPDSRDPLEYITHQLSQRVAALEAKRGPGRPKVAKDL